MLMMTTHLLICNAPCLEGVHLLGGACLESGWAAASLLEEDALLADQAVGGIAGAGTVMAVQE